MALSWNTNPVDYTATRSPPVTSTSNEKGGTTVLEEPDVSSNAKIGVIVEVSELSRGSPKPWTQRYLPSFRESFIAKRVRQYGAVLVKFAKFVGPGAIISIAYIDPDNFQTSVTSGAEFQFKLLVMVLLANLIAIYLQALAVKLGAVTGMDLAQMNRAHLPRWLNIALYVMAEAAIVCTDVSQVIGAAIAINLLCPKIPLIGGCLLAATDTLLILLFYKSDGSLRAIRGFELFINVFVLGVFISFCIELSLITAPVGSIFRGFLPSKEIFVFRGLYQSSAILGGTLTPHTLYLGSGLVQARLRDFDSKNENDKEVSASRSRYSIMPYKPSLPAIRSCLSYSIAELCITLFVVAVFVNSALVVIAATSLSEAAQDADLYGMYDLFVSTISRASGTLFALSLLFSGVGAGIVATMAGQLVCEGAMNWRMSPFLRRLLTRSVAIIPGVIIAGVQGRYGMASTLIGCNVVISVTLMFITFPIVWYTSFDKYMKVEIDDGKELVSVPDGVLNHDTERTAATPEQATRRTISLANNWATATGGWLIWFTITCMNVASLVLLGLGLSGD